MGDIDCCSKGCEVDSIVGRTVVGPNVGRHDGLFDGCLVVTIIGNLNVEETEGSSVGDSVGSHVGSSEGSIVESTIGMNFGAFVDLQVGFLVGRREGIVDGIIDCLAVGEALGL